MHQFKPDFVEASWFKSPELVAAIRKINQRIQGLAKTINQPPSNDIVAIRLQDLHGALLPTEKIAITARRDGCTVHLFAASLANQPLKAEIHLRQPALFSHHVG